MGDNLKNLQCLINFTLEDILEERVREIEDEHDEQK
jgi:Mg2+/Co2+ transporter CorC